MHIHPVCVFSLCRYNYDALALRLEEERLRLAAGSTLGQMLEAQGQPFPTAQIPNQQDFKPLTQTVMPLPGAQPQRQPLPLTPQLHHQQDAPFLNTIQCLDNSIRSFQQLLGNVRTRNEVLKKQASVSFSAVLAKPILTQLAASHTSLSIACRNNITACNNAIAGFNQSGLSQNRDLNQKIKEKRTLLNQYYMATLGNQGQVGQNLSAVNSFGQSSSSSASSSLPISEQTVSSSID